jgi:myosin heavy subunit
MATLCHYSIEAATQLKHGMAKLIYSKLFDWLVAKVNSVLSIQGA